LEEESQLIQLAKPCSLAVVVDALCCVFSFLVASVYSQPPI